MSPRRRRVRRALRWIGIPALVLLAGHQIWRHGHDYVFPEQFAVVEPGSVYRGAWQMTWPMKRIVREHDIKTVVALAHPEDSPWVAAERDLGEEMGYRFHHIPIVDDRTQGGHTVLYDQLEEAADTIADPRNQPVFFHCHHGINRASMAHMAYRMLHCGYTLDEAQEEIAEQFGLKRVDKGPDYRHMAGFYHERVLPRRQAEALAKGSKPDSASERE